MMMTVDGQKNSAGRRLGPPVYIRQKKNIKTTTTTEQRGKKAKKKYWGQYNTAGWLPPHPSSREDGVGRQHELQHTAGRERDRPAPFTLWRDDNVSFKSSKNSFLLLLRVFRSFFAADLMSCFCFWFVCPCAVKMCVSEEERGYQTVFFNKIEKKKRRPMYR